MNHRLFRQVYVSLVVVCMFIPNRTSAQTATGSITGSVQDTGGGVLVSAKVVIQPIGRQTTTDNQGTFRFLNLAPGEYTVTTTYVGFQPLTSTVTVVAAQTSNLSVVLQVGSEQDAVMVTAPRLHGDAGAVNIERMSSQIVQVAPAGVIQSLPNNNIADAVGRLHSVSLERDEGEGKYVQIRGTEPRLSNITINGINVPAPEVIVRQIKLDAVPTNVVERIEVFKTISADQDATIKGSTFVPMETMFSNCCLGVRYALGDLRLLSERSVINPTIQKKRPGNCRASNYLTSFSGNSRFPIEFRTKIVVFWSEGPSRLFLAKHLEGLEIDNLSKLTTWPIKWSGFH
jgi:hypothetical protein